jgi:putative heme-binding domain-containing protein
MAAEALNLNQVRRLLDSGDPELVALVRAKWGSVREGRNPQRQEKIEQIKEFIRNNPGDPFAGQTVFNNVCAQCHKIYGQGEDVGPDITLSGRNSLDQLLSNVLDPSLVIGAAYRASGVATTDGRVLTGLVVEESPQRIVLKMQGGKVESIARADIDELKEHAISLMPEELENQLKPRELADLFAYLSLDRPPGDPEARQLPGLCKVTPRASNEPNDFPEILSVVAPGFTATAVGEGGLALLAEHLGRDVVVRTHPPANGRPCVLKGNFSIPAGRRTVLILAVAHHPGGDWQLRVKVNGKTALDALVGPATAHEGWVEHTLDLSDLGGTTAEIELHNHPNDWSWEYAYWGRAAVVTAP